jgi:hypothetical protein
MSASILARCLCSCESPGGAEAEVGDPVSMSFGNPLDHPVQTKAPEVVRHPALSNVMGLLPGEDCELSPDQQVPERQYAEVGDAQSRSSLPIYLFGAIQLQHRFFSDGAVLAEAFDFENTSVGLKADLPQSGHH